MRSALQGKCAKQVVKATIVTLSGEVFTGENWVLNEQPSCPRGDLPSGVGYELCGSICQQPAHAEVDALLKAGVKAVGATLYLEGHTYVCPECQAACDEMGIAKVIIGAAPN